MPRCPKPASIDRVANRRRLAAEIDTQGSPVVLQCQRCFFSSSPCMIMSSHPACAECTRHGKPCVGLSWDSLDRTREKLSKDLQAAEEEQAILSAQEAALAARIARLRKTLNQAQSRAKEKALCLAKELADNNDDTENTASPSLDQIVVNLPKD